MRKCYITSAFSGIPNAKRGETIRSGCLPLAFSGAQKRAELIRNSCILGGPQKGGTDTAHAGPVQKGP